MQIIHRTTKVEQNTTTRLMVNTIDLQVFVFLYQRV